MNELMLVTYRGYAKKRRKLRKSRRWSVNDHADELSAYERVLAHLIASDDMTDENAEFMRNWSNLLGLVNPVPPL